MIKMKKKDLQILEIYAQNCRIPHTTIGKMLRVSKDTVSYTVRNLEKKGYLKQYMLFIDARKLGFTRFHLLMKFSAGAPKQELIKIMQKHPFVMWINTFIGRYDIQVIVDAQNSFHLNTIREELFEQCHHAIHEYSILTHLCDLEFTNIIPTIDTGILIDEQIERSSKTSVTTKRFSVAMEFTHYAPAVIDLEILRLLANDPQASIVDMALTLHTNRQTITEHLVNLIEHKIILNTSGIVDPSKFCYVTYYFLVRLVQDTPLAVMKKLFLKLNNIFYAGRMIGDYDMILYLNARNPQELNVSSELLTQELGNYLSHYELLVQDKVHHWRQYTPGIYETLKKRNEK